MIMRARAARKGGPVLPGEITREMKPPHFSRFSAERVVLHDVDLYCGGCVQGLSSLNASRVEPSPSALSF